jgi:hypothetical protein
MSTPSEFELDLDLQLLPAWARQPSTENRYAKFESEPEAEPNRRRGDRPGRPEQRRDRPPGRSRPQGDRPREGGRPGPGFRGAARLEHGAPGRREDRRPQRVDRPEPLPPLPEVKVGFLPEEKGVESLARQVKLTGRAYPLFEIAVLILQKAERYQVQFSVKRGEDGQVLQPLLVCSLDESVWLSQEELAAHVLRKHFDTFYKAERVATDPPKGTYTFVAQCGLSREVLGPPNYHDYQVKLRKLHAERFSKMPFEVFKSRVKIVRDEMVVKQWIEDQSWKTEYLCLNLPEPLRLPTRADVEQHFRQAHLPNLVKTVDEVTLPSGGFRTTMAPALLTLLRRRLDEQRRFPLGVATTLSQQFAGYGLQFFKVNKTVTHVCVARPRYLDLEATVVSECVKRIVEFINRHPSGTRRKLLEALAPAPPPPTPSSPAPPPPASDPAAVEGSSAPAVAAAEPTGPTPEQTAVITDLHWLIHQGHVIEFSDGRLETAKLPKPKPAPVPPSAKPAAESAELQPAAATAPVATLGQATGGASAPESEPAREPQAPPAVEGSPVLAAGEPAPALGAGPSSSV